MSTTITLQPGQPGQGMVYDVHQPLPYPFHIDVPSGDCVHGRGTHAFGDAPAGGPWRLIGLQRGDEQSLVLTFPQFVNDPQSAVGLVPVFVDESGIFALDVPITSATVHDLNDMRVRVTA